LTSAVFARVKLKPTKNEQLLIVPANLYNLNPNISGAADIFSAFAAATVSQDGGLLVVGGLVGGGLFVTTVVAGVIACRFEPQVRCSSSPWILPRLGWGHRVTAGVRCSFFDRILHSRIQLVPIHVRLKLLHACDQCHSSRESIALTVFIINHIYLLIMSQH
jgi:hypothetical protein